MRGIVLIGAAVGLAGCMQASDGAEGAKDDTCGAGAAAEFLGASRSVVEAAPFDQPKRVLGATDVMTMDFNPNRINFILDENDVVTDITCG